MNLYLWFLLSHDFFPPVAFSVFEQLPRLKFLYYPVNSSYFFLQMSHSIKLLLFDVFMVKIGHNLALGFSFHPIHDGKKARNQINGFFLSNTMLLGNTLSILVIVVYEPHRVGALNEIKLLYFRSCLLFASISGVILIKSYNFQTFRVLKRD
jgi:hypothetical protein